MQEIRSQKLLFGDEAHAVNKRPEGRNGFFRSLNATSNRARVYGFEGNILDIRRDFLLQEERKQGKQGKRSLSKMVAYF